MVASGALVISGCTTTDPESAPASQAASADGMKGIEKPSPENTGWADSFGQFILNSLYATAVANQSH